MAATLLLVIGLSGCAPDQPVTGVPRAPGAASATLQRLPHADAAAALAAARSANLQIIASAPGLVPPGAPLTPFIEARLYAIANVAVHDALNGIVPRYSRYADTGPILPAANAAAAVLKAAHDAIVGADPAAQASADAWYAEEIAALGDRDGLAAGITLGARAAAAVLTRRVADGTAGGGVAPYTPGGSPGDYQFTPPFNTPAFDVFGTGGFADASRWGTSVTPFVLTSASQFRAPRPYGAALNAAAVLTPEYTADYNEIKALGCMGCADRTAQQTEVALFWMENSPTGWNRIARVIADQRSIDAWDTARLLAVLALGEFDAYTASLESKYYYSFWRPITAVALAGTDGNPATAPVAGWDVLAPPTPPVPDFPSAHATAGGAAAAIIESLVPGKVAFTTSSGSLPGVTRTFASVAQAAKENADSRVYIGYHFRHATVVGMAQGRSIGTYVATHALLPILDDR